MQVMWGLLCLLSCALLGALGQNYPLFLHDSVEFSNNSFINRGIISQTSPLQCVTDHTPCCDADDGGWRDPAGNPVYEGLSGATELYVTRTTSGEINLHRISEGSAGMWECEIPGSSGNTQRIYIYLGVADTGSLSSAEVTFSSLLTNANQNPPKFILTCLSEGGPASSVSWQRNADMISEDGDHETSQVLVDTGENTVYENTLRVTGREAGQYLCTVSSNRDDFFGTTGSTVTSEPFTVTEAGVPTRVNAVMLTSTSILVTWTPPSDNSATGYEIFYSPDAGSDVVTGGEMRNFVKLGLEEGVSYTVSVVALSAELPSTVVGPVTPTTLIAPNVAIREGDTAPHVGFEYTIYCDVEIPDGIVPSELPHVEVLRPGDDACVAEDVEPTGTGTYTGSCSMELTVSSNGTYTCSATYTVNEDSTSPAGRANLDVLVTIQTRTLQIEIEGGEVPYISNDINLVCGVILQEVQDVSVGFTWNKGGEQLVSSSRITVGPAVVLTFGLTISTVEFVSLEEGDSAEYTCEVTVSPIEGNVDDLVISDSMNLAVITPTVSVTNTPLSVRVLDVAEYDDFTITCTAEATADDAEVPLQEIVWDRSVNSGSFQAVSPSSYTVTGSASDGYTSVLMGSENQPSDTFQYRCRAALLPGSSVASSSTSDVTVTGPRNPLPLSSSTAIDFKHDRVMIEWTVSAIAYTPETYSVQYGTDQSELNRMSADTKSSGPDIYVMDLILSLPLTGLQPMTTYYYRVVVSNSHGSTENDVQSFMTTARVTSPPTELTVVEAPPPLSYTFTWGPPLNLFSSSVLSYTVSCTPLLPGAMAVMFITSDNTTHTATLQLAHGLSYTCCVLASNGAGPSNTTCLATGSITTPQSPPSGSPQDFTVSQTMSTNLNFTWSPPAPDDHNGPITGYTFLCSGFSSVSLSASTTTYLATDLQPFTNYTCTVFASNAEGDGPPTELTTATLQAAPSAPPQDFTHSVTNGEVYVIFQWSPPPENTRNGVITGYTVSCNSTVMTTLPASLSLNVTSLTPAALYHCTISASTAVGQGPQSDPRRVITVPSVPKAVNVTEQTEREVGLLVEWSAVSGRVTGYSVVVTVIDDRETQTFTTTDFKQLILSQEVGGYERVSVQVTAVNSAGSGPPSPAQISRTPPIAPSAVSEISATGDPVTVTWAAPDRPNGVLTGYNVSVELYDGGRAVIGPENVDDTTQSKVLNTSSLEDGVPYNVVVVAINQVGPGQENPLLWFSGELPPLAVELDGKPTRSDNGDITLKWQTPSPVQARGFITMFQIQFEEVGGGGGNEEEGKQRRQDGCSQDSCELEAGKTGGCCEVGSDQTSVTITGADPSKSYDVSVTGVTGGGVGETAPITVPEAEKEEEGGGGSGFPIAAVLGVVVAVVVVALVAVIVAIIIVLYRRTRKKKGYRADPDMSLSDDVKPGSEMVRLSAVNITRSPEDTARMRPIELDHFEEHVTQMHQDRDKGFELEYQTFSSDLVAGTGAAKNKNKNRFANIVPYDNNRVKLLEVDGMEGSDYVNASFVDGYSRKNAYIAAQGPMSGTVSDFWRMIWEHKPTTLVMLTKQVEGGKRKCEMYWPEKVGGTFNAGSGIHIVYRELIPYADYEIKIFTVTHAGRPNIPPLEVRHFQFLSWPDHGVPKFATALISFIRRLRQQHNTQSAMLVHCSAGVGRTGAFILLDSMLERIMSEKTVNVYEFLTQLREQRVNMVQTLAQYVFIHDALVELITCGDTSISSGKLREQIRKLHKIIPEKAISGFTDQFRLLQRVSRRPAESDVSDGLESYNKEKNHYPGRVPYNMNRVHLRPSGVTGADYINASFLDGYKQRGAYLATQAPLPNTVNDFWRMMWEFKSRAIVMLCQLSEEKGQEMSCQYWPAQRGAQQLCGKNVVTLVSEEPLSEVPEVVVRKFEITDDNMIQKTSTFSITQYQVLSWPEQGRVDTQLLIRVIEHLTKLQRNTENKPITVMCNDGMGRTGAFICIHAMLERMKSEGVVDFFQFVKSSRINRPDIIRDQEHYILCHDTVADYVDSFDTYANFKP